MDGDKRFVTFPTAESCAQDVADRGGATLEEVGEMLGMTRERVRQIESDALKRPGVREVLAVYYNND